MMMLVACDASLNLRVRGFARVAQKAYPGDQETGYHFMILSDSPIVNGAAAMPSSYTLGAHFEEFIRKLVKGGRYSSASEVIRDGLRLLEAQQQLHQAETEGLKREIEKGRQSGGAKPAKEVFERLKRKYAQMAKDRGVPLYSR
jgi:antitoxin ParD1/3/4